MSLNSKSQINAPAYSLACDESSDVNDVERIAFLCRYINSKSPQEEMTELKPFCGQTRGEVCFELSESERNYHYKFGFSSNKCSTKYERAVEAVWDSTGEFT